MRDAPPPTEEGRKEDDDAGWIDSRDDSRGRVLG